MVMTRPPAYHPGNFLMKNMNPTNSGLIHLTISQEKRLFLLFAFDCRSLTELALLPAKSLRATNVSDH